MRNVKKLSDYLLTIYIFKRARKEHDILSFNNYFDWICIIAFII